LNERSRFVNNQTLLKLFDSLRKKYISASKGREDTTRFILRKALSSRKNKLSKEMKISTKEASLQLCKRYFNFKEELSNKIDLEEDEEILNYLLPYKKNSRNKTANNSFIKEIFTSESFYLDYLDFLKELDSILKRENQMKTEKFLVFLIKCVEEDRIEEIQKFARLPWLNLWIEATKRRAKELVNVHTKENIELIPKEKKYHKKKKIKIT